MTLRDFELHLREEAVASNSTSMSLLRSISGVLDRLLGGAMRNFATCRFQSNDPADSRSSAVASICRFITVPRSVSATKSKVAHWEPSRKIGRSTPCRQDGINNLFTPVLCMTGPPQFGGFVAVLRRRIARVPSRRTEDTECWGVPPGDDSFSLPLVACMAC